MEQTHLKSARIDMRLPVDQKAMIEYAAQLEGYKNITEFILVTLSRKAERVIKRRERFLSSKNDQEIFFASLINPPVPNENLLKATKKYVDFLK